MCSETAAAFSSSRSGLLVPTIGTIQWRRDSTQAIANCDGVQHSACANSRRRDTRVRFRGQISALKARYVETDIILLLAEFVAEVGCCLVLTAFP